MQPTPTSPPSDADRRHLDRAFELGEQARGRVSPNPFVGCVVVGADGDVVGEGWTRPPGGPHAEVVALQQAGDRARGGSALVTLEPCNHTGRTPPCTQALVDAGVARVVFALTDPSPIAGGGAAALRAAGVDVVADADVARGRRVHEVFVHGCRHGRPFVVWKAAMSFDGHIADHTRRSKWITGEATRRLGRRLRAEVDAVLIGSQTALEDDPLLTVRLDDWDGPDPLRVVLDRRGRLADADLALLAVDGPRTLVLDEPTPKAVLARLWEEGVRSVLVEGGATVAGSFVTADLVDRYVLHYGNVLLGAGSPPLAADGWSLADAARLELASVTTSGDDVVVTAYPNRS